MTRPLYFDWAATAPLREEARAAWLQASEQADGNASSVHAAGRRSRALLQQARRTFAAALGVERDDLFFLGNGSEANLVALEGAVARLPPDRRHLLVSPIDHPSVLEPLRRLGTQGAIELEELPVDGRGRVDVATFAARLRPTTGLVSVMLANHEIGTVEPVAELAAIARRGGALVHCDAVQALGKLPVRLDELGVDLLVVSPHKIGGPRGVGVLARRRGVEIATPLSPGRQEQGIRGGTEDVASCVAAAAALAATLAERDVVAPRLRALARLLVERTRAALPDVTLHCDAENGVPGLVNFSFDGVRGDWLVAALDLAGVAASHGAACASLSAIPSHVFAAIGAPRAAAGALRLSMGRATTRDDVVELVERLRAALVQLRPSRDFFESQHRGNS